MVGFKVDQDVGGTLSDVGEVEPLGEDVVFIFASRIFHLVSRDADYLSQVTKVHNYRST